MLGQIPGSCIDIGLFCRTTCLPVMYFSASPEGRACALACRAFDLPFQRHMGVPYSDFVLNIQPDDYRQLNSRVQRLLDNPAQLRAMQAGSLADSCASATGFLRTDLPMQDSSPLAMPHCAIQVTAASAVEQGCMHSWPPAFPSAVPAVQQRRSLAATATWR